MKIKYVTYSNETKKYISVFLLLLILLLISTYFYHNHKNLTLLNNIKLSHIFILLVLNILIIGTNGFYLNILVKYHGISLRVVEWFGLSSITTMCNYLTPLSGGTLVRAVYLKRKHSFQYSSFLANLAAGYAINYAVISMVGVIVTLSLYSISEHSFKIQLLFIASFLSIAFLSYIPTKLVSISNRAFVFVKHTLEGINNIRKNNTLIIKLLLITMVNIMIGALIYQVTFHALGQPIFFRVSLLVYLLSSFSILFNITPGNFGIQEFIMTFSCVVLGIGADIGLLASLIIRAAALCCAFSLGPLFSYIITKELKSRQ